MFFYLNSFNIYEVCRNIYIKNIIIYNPSIFFNTTKTIMCNQPKLYCESIKFVLPEAAFINRVRLSSPLYKGHYPW